MSELSKLRLTVFPNGLASFLVDNNAEIKDANYTVVIGDDSGKSLASTLDGIVYTLPSIAIGNTVTFINMADDGQGALNISPAAADGITYAGSSTDTYAGSSTDNKDLINTKATAKKGDFVTLASLDGTVAWQVVAARGVWAKEA
jgi:hypothetical protein